MTERKQREHREITEDTHMTDTNRDTDDTRVRLDRGSPPSTPRWVKVFGIIALGLILLVIILHLTGNSFGGPMGHGMQLP